MARDLLQHAREVVGTTAGVLVKFSRSSSVDAFGRLRVSNPKSRFTNQLTSGDLMPLVMNSKITAGGGISIDVDKSEAVLVVSGSSTDESIFQSKRYPRYQPGESQQIMMTARYAASESGLTQEVGLNDANDGLFFRYEDSIVYAVLRSSTSGSPVDTAVAQAAWNLDKMDGTGDSGKTLAPTNAQLFFIDFEWLSVGQVRMGIIIEGTIIYVHEFDHGNVSAGAYMKHANLPVRYRIANSSNTGNVKSLHAICQSVVSEGGGETEDTGFLFSASNNVTTISVTTRRPVLSIRPRALFGGIANRGEIHIEEIDIYSTDVSVQVEVVYGATLTNASWANLDATNSITEIDVAADAVTGGIVMEQKAIAAGASQGATRPPGSGSSDILSRIPMALDIDGNHPTSPLTDSVTVVLTSFVGSTDCSATINFREVR